MICIMQGDAYSIDIGLVDDEGNALTPEMVDEVEVSLGTLKKSYPDTVVYDEGEYLFPLTQTETLAMPIGLKTFQVRVKFNGGDVVGCNLPNVMVMMAKSKEVL